MTFQRTTLIGDSASTELAAQRTVMSFERTLSNSDSTLMSVVRTSLSLIGFGFTIFQFFHRLKGELLQSAMPATSPRRFGFALILLGVVLLVMGIVTHRRETKERRRRRQVLFEQGLVPDPEVHRTSTTLVVAVLLLILGLVAMMSVGLRIGPFL